MFTFSSKHSRTSGSRNTWGNDSFLQVTFRSRWGKQMVKRWSMIQVMTRYAEAMSPSSTFHSNVRIFITRYFLVDLNWTTISQPFRILRPFEGWKAALVPLALRDILTLISSPPLTSVITTCSYLSLFAHHSLSFFWGGGLCMHVLVYISYVSGHTCTPMKARGWCWVLLNHSPPYSLRQGLSTEPEPACVTDFPNLESWFYFLHAGTAILTGCLHGF